MSIQSMILTADPVFNEPGYEAIKGTGEGKVGRVFRLFHLIRNFLFCPPCNHKLHVRVQLSM